MTGAASPAFRRTRRTALGVAAASLLTFVITSPEAPAAEEFNNGTGMAIALAYKINPVFGGLSFGITTGESVAGHQNTAATGQSKAINLGVIGVTLAGEGCDGADPTLAEEDQPQPVIVSSNDEGAEAGKSGTELEGAIKMFAKATKAPYAEATTTVAPLGDPGLALLSGGRSTASSGVIGGTLRKATAVSEIGEVSLLNGLVVLGDMRWSATQATGSKTVNDGTFEIGSLTVAGQKLPIPGDPAQQAALFQDTLGALGFTVQMPQVRVAQGIVFVDPMKIGIVPSDLRDGLVGGVLGVLQPTREDLTDLFAQYSCGSENDIFGNNTKTLVTILDLALGSISGAGSLTLELGGVQATTAEIAGFQGLGVLPPLPELPPAPLLPTTPALDTSGIDTPAVDVTTPPADSGDGGDDGSTITPTAPIADITGDRGGALLGVGLGGLLLLLATAEGDRRKMRRALREIPLEV